jgi:regulator of protease activity HflC (stomatin/prohibitin superfamily)
MESDLKQQEVLPEMGKDWWATWFGQVVVILVLIGVMLMIGFGLKGCVVTSEWERAQVERCGAVGGVWSDGGEMGQGCFVPVVIE